VEETAWKFPATRNARKYLHSSKLIVLRSAKNVAETVPTSTTLKSLDVNAKLEIAELEIKRRDVLVITNCTFKRT
jgi:hypothetical protein